MTVLIDQVTHRRTPPYIGNAGRAYCGQLWCETRLASRPWNLDYRLGVPGNRPVDCLACIAEPALVDEDLLR